MRRAPEYPTEAELERIRRWPMSFSNHMDIALFVCSIWSDYGHAEITNSRDIMRKKCKKLTLVTGGWSGNEDIIRALHESRSLFYMLNWESSHRGGRYVYKFKER